MIIDYLRDGFSSDSQVDLCIIGAGPAGLALACSFLGTGTKVCLLESGGLSTEERSQALCAGSSCGDLAFDPALSRVRAFGGSCNLWGGGCLPLSPADFTAREWIPDSGWPIGYADLEPYYQRAKTFCCVDEHEFVDGSSTRPTRRPLLRFEDDALTHRVFARSALMFGEAYKNALQRSADITVLLHAHVMELQTQSSARQVSAVHIASLAGHIGHVRARHYVLAGGAIENARLLLLSDSTLPQGLGNAHGLVGRYFMDHPSGSLGTLRARASHRVSRPYERNAGRGDAPSFAEICVSDHAQRSLQILGARVRPVAVEGAVPKGLQALRALRQSRVKPADALHQRLAAALDTRAPRERPIDTVSSSRMRLALQLGLSAPDLARALGRRLIDQPMVPSREVELIGYFEQAPNPDSRVTLGEKRDALGQRQVCINWQLTDLDRHTYATAAQLFADRLARVSGGTVALVDWLQAGSTAPPRICSTAHHIGTTRMAADPRHGVVDAHAQVHGIDNLHIAGSSVFPTGGWAFPTLTIVALSLRLADRLHGLLRRELQPEVVQTSATRHLEWAGIEPAQAGAAQVIGAANRDASGSAHVEV